MRDRLILTLIVVTMGTLFTSCPLVLAQEPLAVEPLGGNPRTVTVAGRVSGAASLQNAEVLAIMLLPGWSETLSSDISAGTAPMVTLQSGRMERVTSAPKSLDQESRRTGAFEFRNIPPGEYQTVAVRIKDGADAGAAIAGGARVIVADRDISDLELELAPLPLDESGRRQGGAADREPTILESVGRTRIDLDPPPSFPRRPPIGPGPGLGPGRFPPMSTSSGSTKKDVLSHIIFGLSVVGFIFLVTR